MLDLKRKLSELAARRHPAICGLIKRESKNTFDKVIYSAHYNFSVGRTLEQKIGANIRAADDMPRFMARRRQEDMCVGHVERLRISALTTFSCVDENC